MEPAPVQRSSIWTHGKEQPGAERPLSGPQGRGRWSSHSEAGSPAGPCGEGALFPNDPSSHQQKHSDESCTGITRVYLQVRAGLVEEASQHPVQGISSSLPDVSTYVGASAWFGMVPSLQLLQCSLKSLGNKRACMEVSSGPGKSQEKGGMRNSAMPIVQP